MVSQWLGHKDSAMIRVYYHMHDDDAQRQIKNVDFAGAGGRNGAAASA
jgi:integrase